MLMRKLLTILTLTVAVSAPSAANAAGMPTASVSMGALRAHFAGPAALPAATKGGTSPWLTGALSLLIVGGTIALALYTERSRADDDGSDDDGGTHRGRDDDSRSPHGPGGEDLHWSLFEAEFWDYVRTHEHQTGRGFALSP